MQPRWVGSAAAAMGMLLLVVPGASAAPEDAFAGEPQEIRDVLKQVHDAVDGQNVYDCIDEITKDAPASYRLMGTPTKEMFLSKYGDVFADLGLKSKIVYFTDGKRAWDPEEGPAGANIIGVYEGRDPTKWVVMGGHYDTQVATQGGGAHDNGSGICTIKEVARVVATLKPDTEASWVFAWWDGEEWGLWGSRAFVADHTETKSLFNLTADTNVTMLQGISVDMAGLVWPAHNPWANGGGGLAPAAPEIPAPLQHFHLRGPPVDVNASWRNFGSYGNYEALKEHDNFTEILEDFKNYRAVVKEVYSVYLEVPEEHVSFEEDAYGRTDHIPFMAVGVPGLRVQGAHDAEYPCYHQPCDTLEFMSTAAGGVDLLVAGMTMETRTTALISTYVALKGDLVPIGANTTATEPPAAPEGAGSSPAPAAVLVLGAVAAGMLALRRR